jgi:hypothetical protein
MVSYSVAMSRGELSQELYQQINASLPDLDQRFDSILQFEPNALAIAFERGSSIPDAAVCLLDALRTISSARYALAESQAHGMYHRDVKAPPEGLLATWYELYYVDDAAHRLYAAAEHIANGILVMLEIPDEELQQYRKGRTSQQGAVGRLLLERHRDRGISKSIARLVESADWKAALDYRGRLVHSQPPLVSGLGIVYKRGRSGWRQGKNGTAYLPIGGGDPPEFSTSQLMTTFRNAIAAIVRVWDDSLDEFLLVLRDRGGIELKDGTLHIRDYYRDKIATRQPRPEGSQEAGS